MMKDRTGQTLGAALATLWLAAVLIIDLAVPSTTVVFTSLLALAPLIACSVLSAYGTSGFAGLAIALAAASGVWDQTWGTGQQVVRMIDVSLISLAAVVVAAVRVRREQRFARVVVIAEAAQRAILPTLPAVANQVAVAARYLSAAEDAVVGGDLYDCYHSAAHTRFLVGDVRGKGIAAVEQAARVIRSFRQSAATMSELASVAQDMSSYLAPFFDDEEFVTACLVDVSDPTRLTLVSCGHPPPVLVSPDGSASFLEAPAGLPLGMGETYCGVTVPWAPGQRLLMYTDGLSEARDEHGQFLPLLTLAPLLTGGPIDAALDRLLDVVRGHVASGHLADDLAVMLLENVAVGDQPAGDRPQQAQDLDTPPRTRPGS